MQRALRPLGGQSYSRAIRCFLQLQRLQSPSVFCEAQNTLSCAHLTRSFHATSCQHVAVSPQPTSNGLQNSAVINPSTGTARFDMDTPVVDETSFAAFQQYFQSHHSQFLSSSIPVSDRVAVVAISGGVDSAVCAKLMQSVGYKRVVGVHMRNWDEIEESGYCTGEKDRKDAIAICESLGIEFEQLDFTREYFLDVFQQLLEDYGKGFTPSPDVLCNRIIKFHLLLQHVRQKYGEHAVLVTGHYARILQHPPILPPSSPTAGASSVSSSAFRSQLLVALDPKKDQSYFLSSVPYTALASCIFPLGQFHKTFVKQLAAKWEKSISSASALAPTPVKQPPIVNPVDPPRSTPYGRLSRKKESMGICFIGKRSMTDFLHEYIQLHGGNFVDIDTGKVVAKHTAWEALTIGQKANIPSQKSKYYVCGKLPHSIQGLLVPPPEKPKEKRVKTIKQFMMVNNSLSSSSSSPFRYGSASAAVEGGGGGSAAADPDSHSSDPKVPISEEPYAVYVCNGREHPALLFDDLMVDNTHWIEEEEPMELRQSLDGCMQLLVKVRSSPNLFPASCIRVKQNDTAPSTASSKSSTLTYQVVFPVPQHALTLGQNCVFYDLSGRRCLGEGRISHVGRSWLQQGKTHEAQNPPN